MKRGGKFSAAFHQYFHQFFLGADPISRQQKQKQKFFSIFKVSVVSYNLVVLIIV